MRFTTAEIISAGTGMLCCDIGRIYEIMNFLTGDSLFTHQLPRAFHASKEWIEQQCPWLKELKPEDCSPETWQQWLANAVAQFGPEHELNPLPLGTWKPCDPIKELIELTEDKSKVIVVQGP